ncbi:hypothetical protein [Geminocystis sp.]|uniref:GspE/PulE/PilB domain-containing protein n=1 Tax=Geminocystis sp. TaxID=2664100 RepID=UPI003593D962
MECNHKYLYKDLLDEYYRCLETIDSNYNALNIASHELSKYQEKLQEGKQLVKSFGFNIPHINNEERITQPQTTSSKLNKQYEQYKQHHLLELEILYGVPSFNFDLEEINISKMMELIKSILPIELCRVHKLLPLRKLENQPPILVIAMVNPDNLEALDEVRKILYSKNLGLQRMVITDEDYNQLLSEYLETGDVRHRQKAKTKKQEEFLKHSNYDLIQHILVSVKQTFEIIQQNEKLIEDLRKDINSHENSNSSLLNKLEQLANEKLAWVITNTIIVIIILSLWLAPGSGWIYFFLVVSIFVGTVFFVNIIGKLVDVKKEREKLEKETLDNESQIRKLLTKVDQTKTDIKQDENKILKLLSEIIQNYKLADQTYNEQVQQFEQVWKEQLPKIKGIMARIETSESPEVPPRLLTLNWDDPLWIPSENDPTHWQPQTSGLAPDIVRIGEFELKYSDKFAKFPAFFPIRDFSQELSGYKSGHIAFYSEDTNYRQTALLALQSIAFRIISSFPVRKFKGIFIDPISMGNTFPFSNLHNFITDQKTYTRGDDIREQLRGLTEHIEQVIQNYLSSNYATIEDYNFDAGAIAPASLSFYCRLSHRF